MKLGLFLLLFQPPPPRHFVLASWNSDDESLIFTYFSYFGIRNLLQLVSSDLIKYKFFYSFLNFLSRIFYLVNFCQLAVFLVWLQIFKLLYIFWFSRKSHDFWYLGPYLHKFQEYVIKFIFFVKALNPNGGADSAPPMGFLSSNTPWEIGLNMWIFGKFKAWWVLQLSK